MLARAGLHGLVKDIIKRRQQDDEKAEKLFIDSILDCDFMDEEEVCYHFSRHKFPIKPTSSAVRLHWIVYIPCEDRIR